MSDRMVGCNLVQTTVPLGIGSLTSNGEVLSQKCYKDSEDAYIAFSGAPPLASTSWLSQVQITPSSAASFVTSSSSRSSWRPPPPSAAACSPIVRLQCRATSTMTSSSARRAFSCTR